MSGRTQKACLMCLALLPIPGCREDAASTPGSARDASHPTAATDALRRVSPSTLDPQDVVTRVAELRRAGTVSDIGEWILSERRTAVIELVEAVDRAERSSANLRRAAEERLGPAAAISLALPDLSQSLGALSRDVRAVDQSIDGDEARVMFQVADRLPLERATLVRRDGMWLLDTGAPVEGVPRELRAYAVSLDDLADRVRRESWTAAALQDELRVRREPIARRVHHLTAEARGRQ